MSDKKSKKNVEAEKATHQLVKAIDDDPYNVDNYYQLGVVLTEMQSFSQAEELLKRAINIFSKQKNKVDLLTYGLGNVYYTAGLYENAITEFQKINSSSLQYDAYLMIGQANYAHQNYQQAIAFALTANEKKPSDKEPKRLLADCFLALGQFKQAESFYQQVLRIDESDVRALFQLGVVKLTLEGPQAADHFFDKVRHLDYDYFDRMNERLGDVQRFIKSRKQKNEY